MKAQMTLSLMLIILVAPEPSAAQVPAEVTLKVPVNLTKLGPDVTRIRLQCSIQSDAITAGENLEYFGTSTNTVIQIQEFPVSGGQVVTTASFMFGFAKLNNPVGKSAAAGCNLVGWSESQMKYLQFGPGETNPSFRVTSTVTGINSYFDW
jgi:hypothetical protein